MRTGFMGIGETIERANRQPSNRTERRMEKKRNTVKTISYVMIITLAGKFMALLRGSLLSQAYGTGMEANAFSVASQLPRVFFDAIFVSAITMSFIPVFSKCMQEGGKKKAFDFSDSFITLVGLLMVVLSGLGVLFSDQIAAFSATGFDAEALKLTSELLKILFPTMFFTGIAFSFIGILQSLESFLVPALTSVVFNAVIIGYFFGPNARWQIHGLAVVFLIGWVMQAAIQVPALHKAGYRFHFNFQWNSDELRQVGILLLPVMVSTWVQPFNIAVNIRFASGIYPDGAAVSAINFANDLYTMIISVFVLSVMNVIFPRMSDLVNQGKKREVAQLTGQTLSIILLFVVPMMVGLMSVSAEVIRLIYAGNRFEEFSIAITSQALFYFALGMIGYALQTVLARVYFAERRGKVPMIGAMIAILSNVLLCTVLAPQMKIGGLALASSLSSTIYGVALLLPLLKTEYRIFDRTFFADIGKMLLAAGAMAAVIYGVKPFLSELTGGRLIQILSLGILTGLGVIVYGIGIFLLKVQGLEEVKRFIREKRSRKAGTNPE